jgi:hypothetical protein
VLPCSAAICQAPECDCETFPRRRCRGAVDVRGLRLSTKRVLWGARRFPQGIWVRPVHRSVGRAWTSDNDRSPRQLRRARKSGLTLCRRNRNGRSTLTCREGTVRCCHCPTLSYSAAPARRLEPKWEKSPAPIISCRPPDALINRSVLPGEAGPAGLAVSPRNLQSKEFTAAMLQARAIVRSR